MITLKARWETEALTFLDLGAYYTFIRNKDVMLDPSFLWARCSLCRLWTSPFIWSTLTPAPACLLGAWYLRLLPTSRMPWLLDLAPWYLVLPLSNFPDADLVGPEHTCLLFLK